MPFLNTLIGFLSENTNGGVIVDVTQKDSPIIYVNKAFEELTGYSATEVIGKNCRFLQGGDKNQVGILQLGLAINQGIGCKVLLRNYRKDGLMFWNDLAITPIKDDEGKVKYYIGIQSDISARLEGTRSSQDTLIKFTKLDMELLQIQRDISNLLKIVQIGNGNPSLIRRVDKVETRLDDVQKDISELKALYISESESIRDTLGTIVENTQTNKGTTSAAIITAIATTIIGLLTIFGPQLVTLLHLVK